MKLIIKEKNIKEADTKLLGNKELSDAVVDLNFKVQQIVTDLHSQKIPLQVAVEYIEDKSAANKLASLAESGMVTLADIFMSSDVLSNIDKDYIKSINHGDKSENH